jgi:hypothetical protein
MERVHRRLEREQPLTGPVSPASPTDVQRAAAERLLGRAPRQGRSLTVRLETVDAVLRRSGISPDGLAAAHSALAGPVTPLSQTRNLPSDGARTGRTESRMACQGRIRASMSTVMWEKSSGMPGGSGIM